MSKRDTTNGDAGVDEQAMEAVGPEPAGPPLQEETIEERLPVYAARSTPIAPPRTRSAVEVGNVYRIAVIPT